MGGDKGKWREENQEHKWDEIKNKEQSDFCTSHGLEKICTPHGPLTLTWIRVRLGCMAALDNMATYPRIIPKKCWLARRVEKVAQKVDILVVNHSIFCKRSRQKEGVLVVNIRYLERTEGRNILWKLQYIVVNRS